MSDKEIWRKIMIEEVQEKTDGELLAYLKHEEAWFENAKARDPHWYENVPRSDFQEVVGIMRKYYIPEMYARQMIATAERAEEFCQRVVDEAFWRGADG